ncbi:MAG TPA: hypothetical protein VNF73_14995 [Candidatus Saccharimonadales bacterium]|nr:hypothetical protein [Candidatus Saccharimonadales bacterium]
MVTVVTLGPAEKADRLGAYREARRRGVAWLLRQLNRDGSIGDPSTGFSYYRAPWTFTVVGETEAATTTSAWVRRHLLAPDGRIDGPYRVFDEWATYRDATLVVGACLAMQYDLAFPVWRALLEIRDPRSGVFPSDRLPGGGVSDSMDVTGGGPGCGFAALAVGDLETARGIAHFLQRLWDVQPALPGRFHHVWSRTRQAVITETDPEFNASIMVTDNVLDAPQYWFWGGISAAFLGRLWLADPRPHYLELARRYQGFAMAATDAQFKYPAACKGSWGASLLYQITGEAEYEAFAYRMGDWYVGLQEPDGWWHPLEETSLGDVIEITLEFVMHLDTIIGALASRLPVERG